MRRFARNKSSGLLKKLGEDRLDHLGGVFVGETGMARGAGGDEASSVRVASGDFQIDEVGAKIPCPPSIVGDEDFRFVGHHCQWAMSSFESSTAKFGCNERIGSVVVVESALDVEALELIDTRSGIASSIGR